jgi:hypothetical protein
MPSEDCDLVAGMVAGADSIFNMGSLRHGGMRWLLDDVRALSTLVRFALSRSGAFGSSTASLPGFGSAGQPGPILIGTKPNKPGLMRCGRRPRRVAAPSYPSGG